MLQLPDRDAVIFAPSICAGCCCKNTFAAVDDVTCPYYRIGDFTYNSETKKMCCPNYVAHTSEK
jgi:hypothetical protein